MPRTRDEDVELTPRQKASKTYDETVEHIRLRVPKGWKDIIQRRVDSIKVYSVKGKEHGSVNAWLQDLIVSNCPELNNDIRTRYDIIVYATTNNVEEYEEFCKTGDFSPLLKYQSRIDYPDRIPEPPKPKKTRKNKLTIIDGSK